MMQSVLRIVRAAVLVMSVAAAGNTVADEIAATAAPEGGAGWACWYVPNDLTIRCLLTAAPVSGNLERVATAERAYDSRLPELVRTIWGHPEQLADRDISIPLWTPPLEMEFADQLARSVMCGTQKSCAVSFDPNHDGRAALRVALRMANVPEDQIVAAAGAQGFVAVLAQAAEEAPAKPSRRRRATS